METEEIQELNLSYLKLVQSLLGSDRKTALLELQLSPDMADLLLSLSHEQLVRLAGVNQFLFRLRFEEAGQVREILESGRDGDIAQAREALLLVSAGDSGKNPEKIRQR